MSYEILRSPTNSKIFELEEQSVGNFITRKKTDVLSRIDAGYYLIRVFLKGDNEILKKIKEVTYHILNSNLMNQQIVVKEDKENNQFSFLIIVSEPLLKFADPMIQWKKTAKQAPVIKPAMKTGVLGMLQIAPAFEFALKKG